MNWRRSFTAFVREVLRAELSPSQTRVIDEWERKKKKLWSDGVPWGVWKMAGGTFIRIVDMTDDHLRHTIALCERRHFTSYSKYAELLTERDKRRLGLVTPFLTIMRRKGEKMNSDKDTARERELIDAKREGFRAGKEHAYDKPLAAPHDNDGPCGVCERDAAKVFPYPKRRVPNVVTDASGMSWRVVNDRLQSRPEGYEAIKATRAVGDHTDWINRRLPSRDENSGAMEYGNVSLLGDILDGDCASRLRAIAQVIETPEIEVD